MRAVILAGGSGTRFWPLSREHYPKQLLKIVGEKSLIQQTIDRISPLIPPDSTYIVTNKTLEEQIRFQLNGATPHFIIEPAPRNTAPAIALAAEELIREGKDPIMAVFSADHVILDEKKFLSVLRAAEKVAAKGYLVTLGIKPSRPETGYGYIKIGKKISNGTAPAFEVAQFVEKPNLPRARAFLRSGKHFWNSGIFVWRASLFLAEAEKYLPGLLSGARSISVDNGILEKSERTAVIPCEIGWSDVGSWSALDDVTKKDGQGNIISGNVLDIGSQNCVLYGNKRVLATVGLKDLVVVDTEDATLVCNKEQAQDVKKIVQRLREGKGEEHLVHRTVQRPWGEYTVLESGAGYKVKRVVVKPGAKLSLQMHGKRSEHWVVIAGLARVTCGESVYDVAANQSTFVPMGVKHRIENSGRAPLVIIEVQSGTYLGEDDITRFDDIYGRS